MRKPYILFFIAFFLLLLTSCKNDNKKEKYQFDDFELSVPKNLTFAKYNSYGVDFLKHHEKTINNALQNSILSQFNIYQNALSEIEKKKIYSTSDSDYKKYIIEEQYKVLDSIVLRDLQINALYFDLINDLEKLNVQYAEEYKIPIDSFKSFYDLDRITLGEEVLMKISELAKDEKKAKKIKQNKVFVEGGELLVSTAITFLIPTGSKTIISKVSNSFISQFSNGLKYAVQKKQIQKGASNLAVSTYEIAAKINNNKVGTTVTKYFFKKVENSEARTILKQQILSVAKTQVASKGKSLASAKLDEAILKKNELAQTREYFKVVENKLRGRIGDYSDGIWTVYAQNIRNTLKYNQELIIKKVNKFD